MQAPHHIGGARETNSNPARGLADQVKVEERRIFLVCVNPHKVVAVVRITATWVAVAQPIFAGIAGLEQGRDTNTRTLPLPIA